MRDRNQPTKIEKISKNTRKQREKVWIKKKGKIKRNNEEQNDFRRIRIDRRKSNIDWRDILMDEEENVLDDG